MSEHLTDRELAELHADPEITRHISQLVAQGEIDLERAVDWLEDDRLARTDGVVHELNGLKGGR